jgi:diguanylate cyclase (GGDEF)-like protein
MWQWVGLLVMRQFFDRFLTLGVPPNVSEELRGHLRAGQIVTITMYTPWMMAANILNALAVLFMFHGHPHVMRAGTWATCIIGISGYVLFRCFKGRKRPKPVSVSLNAIRRAVVNAVLLGGLWGAMVPLLYPIGDHGAQLVMICVIAGMLCGSGFALATVPPAATAFSGGIALGVVWALLLTPSFASLLILAMSVTYVAIISVSSHALARLLMARMVAEEESREQRDVIGLLLNDFAESASDWLWTLDDKLCVTQVSVRLSDITGRPQESYLGRPVSECIPLAKATTCTEQEIDDIRRLRQMLRDRVAFKDHRVPVVVNGQRCIWSFTAKPVYRDDGSFAGYRGVGRDLTEELAAQASIEQLAKYDVLTGLPNRALFKHELGQALDRFGRYQEKFAVLMLDLDHFKAINDTQGHAEGDILLVNVAERLKGLVREIDTVARLGGDEFAIILTAMERPQEAANLAEQIGGELSRAFKLNSSEAMIGVSIGIAVVHTDGADGETLLRHADLALYRSKGEGRGTYHFFEQEMDAAARRRHRLETDLRLGLQRGELELYFQPLVDATSRQVNTFEALVRWNHPEFGMMSPIDFIPLAEEVGLIQPLGAWVIRQACLEALNWPSDIRVAVNLSPVQFRSPSLFTQIKRALDETGLAPDRLEVEITESLLLDANPTVLAMLDALRQLGVRVALDDFGSGYSSLSYLRKFRFDKIKIDRSFVNDIETDVECQAIMDTLIRLARDLKMSLVVEGVETESQLQSLRERGCTQVQGYLIARPGPASTLNAFFSASEPRRLIGAA